MRTLVRRVARTIRQERMLEPDGRVAAAVSGGADSVALAWLLQELAPDFGCRLSALIHVNHHLRGADSDADEAFSVELASRIGVPIEVAHVDVEAVRRARCCSLESAARTARYQAFEDAATRLDLTAVATGHTLDDQAETVLLRLLRGAGPRGLSGIRPRRGRYIRPLLAVDRTALRRYLGARGEAWREDASNQDRGIARNRLRAEVMPALTHFAPGAASTLARLAALAADDEAFLSGAARAARNVVAGPASKQMGASVVLDAVALAQLAPAVARRVVRDVVADLVPGAQLAARHLEAVRRLAATDKSVGHLDLPGIDVDRRAGSLTLHALSEHPSDAPGPSPWPLRKFGVPGEVTVPEAGVVLGARAVRGDDASVGTALSGAGTTVAVRATSVRLPLAVRSRQPGDRFQPLGAPGRRKLQDVLVDRKVPRRDRDQVPVVVDAEGRIVWVVGVAVAEMCRIGPSEDGVLILEQRKA